MSTEPIGKEEKEQALERVLASRTFSRSDQLRNFLQYICRAEFDGRSQEINEYVLGVNVLGRRPDFNPTEESCVRSRAYELRHKLDLYYQSETPDDPVKIEVQKGGYIPRFERREFALSAQEAFPAAPMAVQDQPSLGAKSRTVPLAAFASVAAIALVALAFAWFQWNAVKAITADHLPADATPEVNALWAPFVNSNVPLLLSFDTKHFFYAPAAGLVIRDSQINDPADLAKSKPIADFQNRMGAQELQDTFDYAGSGEVNAAFLLGRFLAPQGRKLGIKHSSSLSWDDVWNNNIIFIGKPNLNPTVRRIVKDGDFVDSQFGSIIQNLHPLSGELNEYRQASTHGSGEKYAIITVLPGPQSSRHILILDGVGSELLSALAFAVTDPTCVKEIMSHLQRPSGHYPEAFQILIQASFDSYVPVKVRYVTHHVLQVQ